MFSSITSLTVRYAETDQMGIVHHSNYLPWFEVGRGDYFTHSGMSYREVEEAGIWLPLLESHVKYKIPAKYLDNISLKTWISSLSGAKIEFSYEVSRDEQILATGTTVHAFTTPALKPVNLKKANSFVWEKLSSLFNQQ